MRSLQSCGYPFLTVHAVADLDRAFDLFTNYCLHAQDTVSAYKAQGTGRVIEWKMKQLLNALSEEVI